MEYPSELSDRYPFREVLGRGRMGVDWAIELGERLRAELPW